MLHPTYPGAVIFPVVWIPVCSAARAGNHTDLADTIHIGAVGPAQEGEIWVEDPGLVEDPGGYDPPALKGLSQRLT
jgi:hypothetical protein